MRSQRRAAQLAFVITRVLQRRRCYNENRVLRVNSTLNYSTAVDQPAFPRTKANKQTNKET